jgi:hypothetical protein
MADRTAVALEKPGTGRCEKMQIRDFNGIGVQDFSKILPMIVSLRLSSASSLVADFPGATFR